MADTTSRLFAQCSGLMFALSQWTEDQDARQDLVNQSDRWFAQALSAAQQERLTRAFDQLNNIATNTENALLSRGPTAYLAGDVRAMTKSCEAIGAEIGLTFR